MGGGVMAVDLAPMVRADLFPQVPMEHLFWRGSALPGKAGWICYRKLKRRLQHRAEARFQALAAALGPDDLALDLGANVGELTALLAAGGAQVHAYEPEPETYRIVSERFAQMGNVVVHHAAVSSYDGAADLVLPASFAENPRSASKAASIAHDRYRGDGHVTHTVQVVDIVRVLRDLGRAPALIKMDIEGAELDVLEALRGADMLGPDTAVFVETHERLDLASLPRVQALQDWARTHARGYVNLYWG